MEVGDKIVYIGEDYYLFELKTNQTCTVFSVRESDGHIMVFEELSIMFPTESFVTIEEFRNMKINKIINE